MARGVNKVILIGNLGQDPEVRFFPSGGAICNVTVATTDSWKDRQSGEQKEATEWHRVVFSNRLAEVAGEYLKKGSKVYVEGSLRTRKWQNQQGQDQYTTEIRANEMQMLDGRGQGAGQAAGGQQGGYQANQGGGYQQQAPAAAAGSPQGQPAWQQNQQNQAPVRQNAPAQAPVQSGHQPAAGGHQQQGGFAPAPQGGAAPQGQAPNQGFTPPSAPEMPDFDDDIPF